MSTPVKTRGREPFVHPALFYRDADEYLAGTVPFIRSGLAAGEPVAVSVPAANLALLRAELGADADRITLMDMGIAGRNPGRIIPGVLRAFADTHPDRHVRIIGEPIWPDRSAHEYPACVQHEALINLAFTGRDVTILCPYDTQNLTPAVLADAEATHPLLIDTAGQRNSTAYDPEAIIAGYNQPLPEPTDAADLTVDATNLAHARTLARTHARQAGLSQDKTADVELVVTELVTNSIDHGGGTGRLRIWTADGYLLCQVHDHGTLTDPLAGRHPVPPDQHRNRGLLLVNHMADLVRLHTNTDGTTFRVHFRL
ncbi:anti-sigma regulatory factor [Amycolatopsis mediterranei S699]|uniref:Anti-sigma regulatory factor n=2 Tax=Amycolatopsis mediterranei TaxID=33910 RepID=A0A9R0P2P3_AMYMS|nr:sensor histidine kinase [Amycolatopsis mediterranei]ADJ48217.1 putative anti-sigma regulatory factor [Amycolatopsis mediterranei U32]AEK45124.1 anti-sigma regulatory factor [Amycolatopsis mediterranei S699]AFO79928.1 anti-sigma regulatory factor [Amycolatopsis mediterranei S699]AGT87056.1 anti-sigma regulatory factor [Amycolatopsis mediterranei RB]KDO10703.1 anti-sigma regulatory factor [Amycolatopsis mediterranei]